MSDEREPGPRPDETRQFTPLEDADDATRIQGQPGSAGPRDDDATIAAPQPRQPDATSILPPAEDGGAGPGQAPWAGRAEVRPPRPAGDDYPDSDWAAVPESEPRGRWWMPIPVGIVALLLLALLGWGIWLIIRAQDQNVTPTPVPTASATAPPSTQPTTTATTQAPTTRPTTTEPTQTAVTIPALRGLSQQDAQRALSRRGLSSRLRFVVSTEAPPGTVIDSDPPEGQEVPPDTTVTLIIAATPPPSTPTASAQGQPAGD